MNCTFKIRHFAVALIWNIAVLSVVCFLAGFLLDIVGSVTDNQVLRGYAYGVSLLATISMFWFGLLAAALSTFIKCRKCGSRKMSLRFPFFISLLSCKCPKCESRCFMDSNANA